MSTKRTDSHRPKPRQTIIAERQAVLRKFDCDEAAEELMRVEAEHAELEARWSDLLAAGFDVPHMARSVNFRRDRLMGVKFVRIRREPSLPDLPEGL